MTDQTGPIRKQDDVLAELGLLAPAEMRLRTAEHDQPVLHALCMALQAWDHVDRRDWRTRQQIVAAARQMAAAGTVPNVEITDAAVGEALAAAAAEPMLIETDGHGRYRSAATDPEFDVFGVGLSAYLDTMRARAGEPRRLSPLEAVHAGNEHHWHEPADLDAAQACYQRAVDSGDPDAAAFGQAGLATLAETRGHLDEAAERHHAVFEQGHPPVAARSGQWLAARAYDAGDHQTAQEITDRLIAGDPDDGVLTDAWSLRSVIAWSTGRHPEAVTAMRTAIEHAGPLAHRLWERLARMHATMGDFSAAADAQAHVIASAFQGDDAVGVYLQLMQAADRLGEAPAILTGLAEDTTIVHSGRLRVGVASAYALLGDDAAAHTALDAARAHWSAHTPDVAARIDLLAALLAVAERDDEHAAQLLSSLVDGDDERRKIARPLLLAAGDSFAALNRPAAFEGARPLLEFVRDNGSPQAAGWAESQLAVLNSPTERS
ncbi:tetratricopeptide repeat protein [Paractinoplanes atraurantiacus]|uniref:Tetratricopeptide repeat-containing protein n=1 Tax=Paractinoplanes atraurantiacus TaxID=1036182 RepID=A0A285KJS1_9ACTN|nr:tetratricopeptide repeat protein [Actinoplanes atraurantiacus]SNY72845.1 Tetratricopeptide repeat-containing protein [Actinoplanes atraurantiacus]